MCKAIWDGGGYRCSDGKSHRRQSKFFGGQSNADEKFKQLPVAFREGKMEARAAIAISSTESVVIEASLADSPAVRVALAKNLEASPETLAALATAKELTILRAVAANPNTDTKTFEALAKHSSPSLRKVIKAARAVRPATPEKPAVQTEKKEVPVRQPVSPETQTLEFGRANKRPPAPRAKPVPVPVAEPKPAIPEDQTLEFGRANKRPPAPRVDPAAAEEEANRIAAEAAEDAAWDAQDAAAEAEYVRAMAAYEAKQDAAARYESERGSRMMEAMLMGEDYNGF